MAISFIYIIDVVVRLIGLGWRSYRANGWNVFDMVVAAGSFITTLIVRFDSGNGYAIQQLQKLFLVSIAFKLVQRMNSLNKLFKTAMYVALSTIESSWKLTPLQQGKLTSHHQLAWPMAHSFPVLCHPLCRGFRLDQVALWRNQEHELYIYRQGSCDACFHEYRVSPLSAAMMILANQALTTYREGWNQYMHD